MLSAASKSTCCNWRGKSPFQTRAAVALGGRFALESPAGRGTTISIELPLGSRTLDERPTP